jgi:hypothetical protein
MRWRRPLGSSSHCKLRGMIQTNTYVFADGKYQPIATVRR